jgi:bud site selection protein 31
VCQGFDVYYEALEAFEVRMKDAVNEPHEGKRKNELTWKIHLIHWEKNRYIYNAYWVDSTM